MEERWRPVVGWEGWYSVSDHGRVRRDRRGPRTYVGRISRSSYRRRGYPAVTLICPGRSQQVYDIHRLVAAAFLGPSCDDEEVNHKDAIRTHNHYSNLEYVTRSQNVAHMYLLGRRKHRGEDAANAKLTADMVRWIRKVRGAITQEKLARFFGTSATNISGIQLRKSWKEA